MLRILIVSEVFWPEDFLINDLALEWKSLGYHVEVVSQYPSYPRGFVYDGYENKGETIEDWHGIKIHRFPVVEGYRERKSRKFGNYLKFIFSGKKVIENIIDDFDLIFVSQTGPLTVALPAILASKKKKVPVAIWTFDIWPDVVWTYGVPKMKLSELLLDKLIGYIYKRCDRIFVSSKMFMETISQYTDDSMIYAPNWLRPVSEEKSDLEFDKNLFHFTFTGNISRYQNLTNTILGFAKADLRNAVLNIVGDGSYADNLKRLVIENDIKNVIFHGRKPYNTMNDVLSQSDVLVLPLINDEGIMKTEPLKLQSYLYAGKPILGILGGSGKAIIEENDLGIVARPDDIDSIAKAFRESVGFAGSNGEKVKKRSIELMSSRFCKAEIVKTITENLPS